MLSMLLRQVIVYGTDCTGLYTLDEPLFKYLVITGLVPLVFNPAAEVY